MFGLMEGDGGKGWDWEEEGSKCKMDGADRDHSNIWELCFRSALIGNHNVLNDLRPWKIFKVLIHKRECMVVSYKLNEPTL